jgi:putative flippase GtrA
VDIALVQAILFLDFSRHSNLLAAALCIGALAGASVNFALSRRYVFPDRKRSVREQLPRFALVSLSTLGLRLLLAHGFLALFAASAFLALQTLPITAAPERLAHLSAVGLVTIYSFFAHKHLSFAGSFSRMFQHSPMVPR